MPLLKFVNIYSELLFVFWFEKQLSNFPLLSFQPLNYEKKRQYTLHITAENTHLDPRFSHLGSFKDNATFKITVGDVDEPPVFSMDYYIMDVYENAKIGTEVGSVTAQDPDSKNSPIR